MNSLSLMLYLADVVGNLQVTAAMIAVFGGIIYGVVTLAWAANVGEFHGVVWPMWLFAACMIVGTFTPSSKTILLIAGSEAGEAVVTSEAGKRIMDQVEAAISAQLAELAVTK